MTNYIGVDQYGTTYHNLGNHPRKELLKRLYATKAEKMYQDKKNGDTVHTGYIIKGCWITLLEVKPFEVKQ